MVLNSIWGPANECVSGFEWELIQFNHFIFVPTSSSSSSPFHQLYHLHLIPSHYNIISGTSSGVIIIAPITRMKRSREMYSNKQTITACALFYSPVCSSAAKYLPLPATKTSFILVVSSHEAEGVLLSCMCRISSGGLDRQAGFNLRPSSSSVHW